jgi:hypothetical protein
MRGQHATKELDRYEGARPVRQVYRVTESIPGYYSTPWSADTSSVRVIELEAPSTATSVFTMSYSYLVGLGEPVSDYDPEFVARVRGADAATPAAKFNNVVDMLDWLDRD